MLSVKQWGFGATYPPSGTPVSETDTTYANVNGTACGPDSAIVNEPCQSTTFSSGTKVSQTTYVYTAAGHLTTPSEWVSPSMTLSTAATYNSNGTIESLADVNGALTNYRYDGTGGCNALLLTSTDLPVAPLTTSQTWNCTGGVLTSSMDPNSQVTQYGYVDQSGVPDPAFGD